MEASSTCFSERLRWIVGKVDNDGLCHSATLAWVAWMCRNKALFDTEVASLVNLAATRFTKLVPDFREYRAQVTRFP